MAKFYSLLVSHDVPVVMRDCKRFHQFRGAQISGKKDGADRRESDETVQWTKPQEEGRSLMGFARRQGPALGCWHRRGRGFGPATDDASAGKNGAGGRKPGGRGGARSARGGH